LEQVVFLKLRHIFAASARKFAQAHARNILLFSVLLLLVDAPPYYFL
jgi:hypothetical protein